MTSIKIMIKNTSKLIFYNYNNKNISRVIFYIRIMYINRKLVSYAKN